MADDVIHIDNAVFTGLAAGALAAGAFHTGAAASPADDRIIYNSAMGALLFDSDGTGAGAAIHFAMLARGLVLNSADFFVVRFLRRYWQDFRPDVGGGKRRTAQKESHPFP